ncbi:hypothetical protein M758_UG261100 [Ceratodon purpureus]|nr:hypothetical protein M758_UG261100 [Ceratodon purpureus]
MEALTLESFTLPNQNPDFPRCAPNTAVRSVWRITSSVSTLLWVFIPVAFNSNLSLNSSKDIAVGGAPLQKTAILSSHSSIVRGGGSDTTSFEVPGFLSFTIPER